MHVRLRLGPGWVSHILQRLTVGLWSDPVAGELVATAERHYANSRFRMRTPAGIRITISDLSAGEIDPLADAVARAVRPAGRAIV
ncbi:hypothetical protein BST14_01635 [Mycobacterium arosiense ATCC BAA-1401 = DSM 45069]|uniref:Uncharacterized protein n=1 Tax=Mycobacterium arosiense ATCC BAA-1401 = DSM 45069 TaxID=1265311 RepID=A0A1W9ZSQ7_MYCAI|nr:hypothetical protein BST14_01635 [Mycobacterium arosiense ATCC BAA-1401 = DSM 45069]